MVWFMSYAILLPLGTDATLPMSRCEPCSQGSFAGSDDGAMEAAAFEGTAGNLSNVRRKG